MKAKTKKPKTRKLRSRDYIILAICVVVPIIIGLWCGDFIIGSALLITMLVSSYLATIKKRSNFIFGLINVLLLGYVSFQNNLFGSFFVNTFIVASLEIYGFFSWGGNLDSRHNVKIRKFTPRISAAVVSSCIFGSAMLGYILTTIPGQQLAFMDSTICCLDICALILANFRFKEAWWVWIVSGILSIIVWTIAFVGGGDNALMRLLSTIGFTIISIYGLVYWKISPKVRKV